MENSLITERKNISKELIKKYGFEIKENNYLISIRDLLYHINNNWKIDFFSNSKTDKYIQERDGKFFVREEELYNFSNSIKGIECSQIKFQKTNLLSDYVLFTPYCEKITKEGKN